MTDKQKTEVIKCNEYMEGKQLVTSEKQLFSDACRIIEQAQEAAYRSVNVTLIKRNWLLGMRIQHEVLKDKRAEYGERVVANLADSLTKRYGRGFSMRNLYNFVSFYQNHPYIFHAVSGASGIFPSVTGQSENILQSATAKSQGIRGTGTFIHNNEVIYKQEKIDG